MSYTFPVLFSACKLFATQTQNRCRLSGMDAKYLTWNFANFLSVNLMIAVFFGIILLAKKYSTKA